MDRILFPVVVLLLIASCTSKEEYPSKSVRSTGSFSLHEFIDTSLTDSVLQDKLMGMLIGSAIGDAMGAPTEMWSRNTIKIEHGFVDGLDLVLREASPEGPWDFNLPAGGTTDDTRWKKLTVQFLEQTEQKRPNYLPPTLDAREFSAFLVKQYLDGVKRLKETDSFDPEPFEVNARKMTWLQEWALVAKPFAENDLQGYADALAHFYGGEMSCAGMLYAPTIGAFYPGKPERAYQETFKLSIFDLGYARDLTSLVAAMTAAALEADATKESVTEVVQKVDPEAYFKSRLIGRTAQRIFKTAFYIDYEAKQVAAVDANQYLDIPKTFPYDSLYYARTLKAYELLERQLQDIPFHAGEIFLINMTALLFCDMDFEKALQFVTNFGRDNDTVGAITGAILGAYLGAKKLPKDLVEQVLKTNKEELGIDLELLAVQLYELVQNRKG